MSDNQSKEIAQLQQSVSALREAVFQNFGTISALGAIQLTLIEAHPDPADLLLHLQQGIERVHADYLAQSPSETALEHFERGSQSAISICQIAIARRRAEKALTAAPQPIGR